MSKLMLAGLGVLVLAGCGAVEPAPLTDQNGVTTKPSAQASAKPSAKPTVKPAQPPSVMKTTPRPTKTVVVFGSCAEARRSGVRLPLTPGREGWNPELDRDGDGKACE